MTVDVAIDTELLKREIKKTYAAVSQEPGTDFIFPTGRAILNGCVVARKYIGAVQFGVGIRGEQRRHDEDVLTHVD